MSSIAAFVSIMFLGAYRFKKARDNHCTIVLQISYFKKYDCRCNNFVIKFNIVKYQ